MKKTIIFLVCLILLLGLACAAQAEPSIQAMPAAQVGMIMPDGLVLKNQTLADGSLTMLIDDDSTNWARAIAQTGVAGNVEMLCQFKVPSDVIVGDYLLFISAENDEEAYEIFRDCERYNSYRSIDRIDQYQVACRPDGMPLSENSLMVARSIPEMSYLNPMPVSTSYYIGWYRQNSSGAKELLHNTYYKLTVDVQHTRAAAFKANVFNGVPVERIKANYSGSTEISVLSQKDGAVNYCIPADGLFAQTGVRAPEDAVSYAVRANMKAGDMENLQPIPSDRYVVLNTSRGRFESNASRQTIFFCDASGNLLEEISINIGYQSSANMLPWPAYSAAMTVVPEERVQIVNNAAQAGYSVQYDASTGHIQGSYTGVIGSSASNTMELRVKAPEDAVSCRIYVSGGTLGHDAGSEAGLEYELNRIYPTGPLSVSSGYVHTETYEAFQKIQPADDPITIFVPPFSANIPNYAGLYVFEWYDDWGDIIGGTEYLWQTVENFAVAERLIPVKQQKELTGPVTQPEIVVPNGSPYADCQLKLTAFYTEGTNAWFYDLTMMDANGLPAKPNTPVWVYLPHPDGHKTGTKYKLNHYTNGMYDGSNNTSEQILIEDTLYGLMFQTSTFSPFILSVQEPDPTPTPAPTATPVPTATLAPSDVPQTGDDYPLLALGCFMLLAFGGLVALNRKRRV